MAGEYRGRMILSVISAIGSVAAGIIPYFLIQRFIMGFLEPDKSAGNLFIIALSVGLLLILKTLLFILSTKQSHMAAYRILRNIRVKLAAKLTGVPLGYIQDRDSGTIKKVMENDVEELERFLAHNIPDTISCFLVPLFVLIYLAFVDWRMTLVMLIFIPAAVLFYFLMIRGDKGKMDRYYKAVDRMNGNCRRICKRDEGDKGLQPGGRRFYRILRVNR